MYPIKYHDRATGSIKEEKVYGAKALEFLYGDHWFIKILAKPLLHLYSRIPLFSWLYGTWQKLPWTKNKIRTFIQTFEIDPSEFEKKIEDFDSFNDFFIRKLKPEARPITSDIVIPADGRYLFCQNIKKADGFVVKEQKFNLDSLLEDSQLASKYLDGTMVIGRLCPTDCHRFYFPCDCIPGETTCINGRLYSVNPISLRKNIHILTQNKRTICELETQNFGKILYLEVGATNVGSIHQTYTPNKHYPKASEKGYFSFGASVIILLFEPNKIKIADDLLAAFAKQIEVRCLIGQEMGCVR